MADLPDNTTGVNGVAVNEPKEVVALTPAGLIVGFEDIVTYPVAEVALKPVIPITSAGANAPTVDVADNPVKPITSAGLKAPTDEVALKDESSVVFEELTDNEPTELVELNPVKPITSAGLKAPTDEVADNAVNG